MGVNRSNRSLTSEKLNSKELENEIKFKTKAWLYPTYAITVIFIVLRAYFSAIVSLNCFDFLSMRCMFGQEGVVMSNIVMNTLIFVLVLKSIYMIRQSVNHQLASQVQLRKILKYNPLQLYLFGFICLLWIGTLVFTLVFGIRKRLNGITVEGGVERIAPRILTLITAVVLSVVLVKISIRQKHVLWNIDSTGKILIAMETVSGP